MAILNPYLFFDGNCAEAMEFYKSVFGGERTMQKVSDTPMGASNPEQADKIMHSTLTGENVIIFASDMLSKDGPIVGNTVALCVNCDSDDQVYEFHKKLSEGGETGHEPKKEFWGDTYGDCKDKFGMRWMFNHQEKKEA